MTRFKADADPSTHTNPKVVDTDTDGLNDGLEDANKNGRVDSGEPNPNQWDTDGDKLPEGKVDFDPSAGFDWRGEDLNLNGIRDQDADGNWTETDFLANDSDVDGILDGAEAWGQWCYKGGGGCTGANNSARALNALNPDYGGDGIADDVGIDRDVMKVVRIVGTETHTSQIASGTPSGRQISALPWRAGFSLAR